MLSTEIITPTGMTIGTLSFALMAKWYIWPIIEKWNLKDSLILLLLPQTFRYIGLTFLVTGVTSTSLNTNFSYPAAFGDLLVALLALLSIFALKYDYKYAIKFVWFTSVLGILDFVIAFATGIIYNTPEQMGATYYLPLVIVPALLVLQVLTIITLIHNSKKNNSI